MHLLNPDNPGKPIIAQIWKTYKRPECVADALPDCGPANHADDVVSPPRAGRPSAACLSAGTTACAIYLFPHKTSSS